MISPPAAAAATAAGGRGVGVRLPHAAYNSAPAAGVEAASHFCLPRPHFCLPPLPLMVAGPQPDSLLASVHLHRGHQSVERRPDPCTQPQPERAHWTAYQGERASIMSSPRLPPSSTTLDFHSSLTSLPPPIPPPSVPSGHHRYLFYLPSPPPPPLCLLRSLPTSLPCRALRAPSPPSSPLAAPPHGPPPS